MFSVYTGSSLLSLRPLTFAKRVLMKPLSGVRARAALSPLIGFPSSFTLIALPLLSPVTHGSYEDIHHSGLSGFKVFPREKGKINRDVKGYYGDLKNHFPPCTFRNRRNTRRLTEEGEECACFLFLNRHLHFYANNLD